jgi:DNA-binding CsgD family transcriptional regulator/tetratricopeptide (TPR) repeat protein
MADATRILAPMAFVGRERELARLAAGLERAASRQPARIALRGPAGIGISRLLTELQARLADLPDVVVLRAAAYEPQEGVPYAPLSAALGPSLESLDDERLADVIGSAGLEATELVPSIAQRVRRLGLIPQDPMRSSPDQQASRLLEAVIGILTRRAGDGVVVLALEDLHHADPGTRRFVETMLRIGRELPICLIVTYRPDELHRRHPMLGLASIIGGDPIIEKVSLGPLERHEVMGLIEGLTGERPSGALTAAVLEGSGGVPLLAEQLAETEAGSGGSLGGRFDDLLRMRLSALSVGAMRSLRVLAAARRPLPVELLLAADFPGGHLTRAALTEVCGAGLAVETVASDDTSRIAVVHEAYAESIEALGLPADRQPVHDALARALRREPAEAAWHLERAMRFAAARNSHAAAGLGCQALDPGGTALLHFQRALELVETHEARVPKLTLSTPELLALTADAAFAADDAGRAAGLAQQAISELAGASAVADAARRGSRAQHALQLDVGLLYLRLGLYQSAAGDHVAAQSSLQTAVQLVPDQPTAERARVLGALAQVLMVDGSFNESAPLAEQARAAATDADPVADAELGHATCTLGVDIAYGGQIDRGLAYLEEAAGHARRAGRLDDLMRTYANRTHLLELDARYDAALAIVQQGIEEARRWEQEAGYGAFLRGNAADILFKLGRWSGSEAECRAALDWSPHRLVWSPLLALGAVLVESRSDDEAGRLVGQILLQLEAVPDGQWTATVQRIAVSYALWRDDVADAEHVARRGWLRVLATGDRAQIAMAASTTTEACAAFAEAGRHRRDIGAVAAGTELASGVVAEAELQLVAGSLPENLGSTREAHLHLATARAHLARLRNRADPDAWAEIASGWEALHVPYLAAKARWWEASTALVSRDRRPQARTALVAAWDLAVELPARPLLREIRRLAQRGRIVLPDLPPSLVPRQAPTVVAVGPGRPAEAIDGEAIAVGRGQMIPGFEPLPSEEDGTQLSLDATGRWPTELAGETATAPGIAGALASLGPADGHDPSDPQGDGSSRTATGRAISKRLLPIEVVPARDPFNLSPREYEVLAIIAEGRTNREIAERLFISERTVAVHVRNILAKLGVSGRVEATSVAIRLGLVPGVAPAAR